MTRVLLVRHAQSEWNAVGRWQGWADPPLSALGREQAREAAAALPWEPDVYVSSDLQRAVHTRDLVRAARAAAATPTATDADLREYDAGSWTGLRRAEIAERWPAELAAWDEGRSEAVPGGETSTAFVTRLLRALSAVARTHPDGSVLAVSHGRALHAVAGALGGASFYVSHLSGWELAARPDGADGVHLELVAPVALLPGAAPAPAVTGSTTPVAGPGLTPGPEAGGDRDPSAL